MKLITRSAAVLLCVVLSVLAVCTVCSAVHAFGDADGDGSISAADARLVLRAAVGLDSPANRTIMDVDGDAEITTSDARLVLRYSVGLETAFPSEHSQTLFAISADPSAKYALLYDATDHQVLFSKNSAERDPRGAGRDQRRKHRKRVSDRKELYLRAGRHREFCRDPRVHLHGGGQLREGH